MLKALELASADGLAIDASTLETLVSVLDKKGDEELANNLAELFKYVDGLHDQWLDRSRSSSSSSSSLQGSLGRSAGAAVSDSITSETARTRAGSIFQMPRSKSRTALSVLNSKGEGGTGGAGSARGSFRTSVPSAEALATSVDSPSIPPRNVTNGLRTSQPSVPQVDKTGTANTTNPTTAIAPTSITSSSTGSNNGTGGSGSQSPLHTSNETMPVPVRSPRIAGKLVGNRTATTTAGKK